MSCSICVGSNSINAVVFYSLSLLCVSIIVDIYVTLHFNRCILSYAPSVHRNFPDQESSSELGWCVTSTATQLLGVSPHIANRDLSEGNADLPFYNKIGDVKICLSTSQYLGDVKICLSTSQE